MSPSRVVGALLLALCAAACNAAGARVHNLGEIHTDDGYHRYSAALLSGWEWTMRSGFGSLLNNQKLELQNKPPKKLDDPHSVCLENLVELGRHTGEGGYGRSVRIATYARLLVACPWKLSRERCAILLGREGRDIDLAGRRVRPPGAAPVGDGELTGALAELLALSRPELEGAGTRVDAAALQQVCERLSAFDYDLDGARRSLSFVALIERSVSRRKPEFDCLRELVGDLQRLTVERALRVGLVDGLPFERRGSDPGWGSARVRAAAVEAWLVAVGPPALGEFLAGLDPREDVDVLLALMRGVAQSGLPRQIAGLSAAELDAWTERWIETLVSFALDHPEGRVRVAAMHALGRVSGGALSSLREEDWFGWIEARRAARADAPQAEVQET